MLKSLCNVSLLSLLWLLLCCSLMLSSSGAAEAATLTSFWDAENARRSATNLSRVGTLNAETTLNNDNGGALMTRYYCNLVANLPKSMYTNEGVHTPSTRYGIVDEWIATVVLAIHHLNTGNDSVVKELKGLPDRCPVRFTASLIDNEMEAVQALDKMIDTLDPDQHPPEHDATDPPVCAFLGPNFSSHSIPTAMYSGLHGIPQISHLATSPRLDNKAIFPTFGRTIPADGGSKLLELLASPTFGGVRYLAILHENDEFASGLAAAYRTANEENNVGMQLLSVEVTYQGAHLVPQDFARAVAILKQSDFRYFLVIGSHVDLVPNLLQAATEQGIAGTGKHVWIFIGVSNPAEAHTITRGSVLHRAYQGLFFSESTGGLEGQTPTFDNFLESYRAMGNPQDVHTLRQVQPVFPEEITEQLFTPVRPFSTSSVYMYDAVVGLGLAACNLTQTRENDPLLSSFTGKDLYNAFKSQTFAGASGEVRIKPDTGSRDPKSAHGLLLNLQVSDDDNEDQDIVKFTLKKSLYYHNGWQVLEPFIFNDGTTQPPSDVPPSDTDMHYIGAPLRAVGLSLFLLISIMSILCAGWTWHYRKSTVVRCSQPLFLYMICIGTCVLGASIVPLSVDDEKHSQQGCSIACMSFPWLFSIGFCVAFSALFTKLHRINKVFTQKSFRRIKVTVRDVMIPMLVLLSLNIVTLVLWTALSPLEWEREENDFNSFDIPADSVGGCKSEYSWVFYMVLAIVNVGALIVAVYEAYKARHLTTEFAESEHISRAMVVILAVISLGIPVVIIASDLPEARFFVLVGIITAISMSLLLFIFIPKELHRRAQDDDTAPVSASSLVSRNLQSTFVPTSFNSSNTSVFQNNGGVGGGGGGGDTSQREGLRVTDPIRENAELKKGNDQLKAKNALLSLRLSEIESEVEAAHPVSQQTLSAIDEVDLTEEEETDTVTMDESSTKETDTLMMDESTTASPPPDEPMENTESDPVVKDCKDNLVDEEVDEEKPLASSSDEGDAATA